MTLDLYGGIFVQSDSHQLPDSPEVRAEDRVFCQQHRHPQQYVQHHSLQLIRSHSSIDPGVVFLTEYRNLQMFKILIYLGRKYQTLRMSCYYENHDMLEPGH